MYYCLAKEVVRMDEPLTIAIKVDRDSDPVVRQAVAALLQSLQTVASSSVVVQTNPDASHVRISDLLGKTGEKDSLRRGRLERAYNCLNRAGYKSADELLG